MLAKSGHRATSIMSLSAAIDRRLWHLVSISPRMKGSPIKPGISLDCSIDEGLFYCGLQIWPRLLLYSTLKSRDVEVEVGVSRTRSNLLLHLRIYEEKLHHVFILCACMVRSNARRKNRVASNIQ